MKVCRGDDNDFRSLEPTGLVKLAEAQIHLRKWGAAAETVRALRKQTWPSRFHEVERQMRDLERKIDDGKQKATAKAK